MKIFFPVIEYHSITNFGELGITIEHLIKRLVQAGQEIVICLPFYKDLISADYPVTQLTTESVNISGYSTSFWKTEIENITVYLVKNNEFFSYRKNIYGCDDDNFRFVFFCLAAVELLNLIDFSPDIVHVNDWHTALIPLLLKLNNKNIKTVLTIHNVNYQGISNLDILKFANIGLEFFLSGKLEFYNKVNILKAGLWFSDLIICNSKNYLEQIQNSPAASNGLNGVLKQLADKCQAITVGVEESFNPKKDKSIMSKYSDLDLSGKLECKTQLQKELDLPVHTEIPILVIPSAYISDDEIWLLNSIIPYLIRMEIQIIILGNKLVDFEKNIREVSFRLNCTVISVEDSEENQKKIFSGADIFLDTSFDFNNDQLIMAALKYGVIPIVFNESPDLEIEANKFRLFNFTTEDLINTIKYTINKYYHLDKWNEKVKKVMSYDFSLNRTAREYISLYKDLVKGDRPD
jgi:starch synthase